MEQIFTSQYNSVLRFNKGDEFIPLLKDFCKEHDIQAGFFYGLGAALEGEIAYYHLGKKKYQSKKFKRPVEILNIIGNVAVSGKELIIHAHGVFGDQNMKTFGGHINALVVGPTLELYLKKFDGELQREFSKDIGLKLLSCPKQ
ncbi:DNA-binding protein [Patescibacteria group bacterium AH-259-L05]|nr:DNA-binding protein [Patescibacteria group bacterium AH-259-L05]